MVVEACGPHIETPRSIVINEMKAGHRSWIELVNPTIEDISIAGWEIQVEENHGWRGVHSFGDVTISRMGSGADYLVIDFNEAIENKNRDVRLVDGEGNEVDNISYRQQGHVNSFSRYKNHDGIPVDSNSSSDWYKSSVITRGFENDRIHPSC
jgi:hypothetical protein